LLVLKSAAKGGTRPLLISQDPCLLLRQLFLPQDGERQKEVIVMLKLTAFTLGMMLMISATASGDSTKGIE